MIDVEVFNIFYEGANPESKDLMNSSSGGNFTKKKVSEARDILGRLIDAKKACDQPRSILIRGSTNALMEQGDERVEARIDRLEKALLSAIEKNNPPASQEKGKIPGPEEIQPQPYYIPPGDGEFQAQVNLMGSWSPNGNRTLGNQKQTPWRHHSNFRWSDNDPNQPPQQQNTSYSHPPERQSNWSGRNQEGQNN